MIQETIQPMMSPAEMMGMFTVTMPSDRPIADIARDVPAACEQGKFALLTTYAYHEIVESKGFPIQRKVFIYEICQAKTAAMMLTSHPLFSVFMPCKIALYEEGDQTILATMNMAAMLPAVQDDPALYEEATTLFATLTDMMESLRDG